jgi:MHS family proline/betaine transporter-like MFS transporter
MATCLEAIFGYYLTVWRSADQMVNWGWRVPFLVGVLIVPAGLYMRRAAHETPEFEEFRSQIARPQRNPFIEVLKTEKILVLIAIGALAVSTASSFIIEYMPAYVASTCLGLRKSDGFLATMLGGCILTFVTPIVGYFADRIRRIKLMAVAAAFYIVLSYPLFHLLTVRPSLTMLLLVVGAIAVIKVVYYASLTSLMADIFPVATRSTGMAVSYNISVLCFGSFAGLISTVLIRLTGSPAAPGLYLVFISAICIAALAAVRFYVKVR